MNFSFKKFAKELMIFIFVALMFAPAIFAQFQSNALTSFNNGSVVPMEGGASPLLIESIFEGTEDETEELLNLDSSGNLRIDGDVTWVIFNTYTGAEVGSYEGQATGSAVTIGLTSNGEVRYAVNCTGTIPPCGPEEHVMMIVTVTVTAYDEFGLPYEWEEWQSHTNDGEYM